MSEERSSHDDNPVIESTQLHEEVVEKALTDTIDNLLPGGSSSDHSDEKSDKKDK